LTFQGIDGIKLPSEPMWG